MIVLGPCVLCLPLLPGTLLLAQEKLALQALGLRVLGLDRQVSAFRPGLPWSRVFCPLTMLSRSPHPTAWCPPHSAKCPCCHPGCRRSRETPRQSLPEGGGKPFCVLGLGFSRHAPGSTRAPLPGPFMGHVLFCPRPLTSFTTRQFSDPKTLFVMLYFTAAASGKWVLYLGTSCLNARPQRTLPQSPVS